MIQVEGESTPLLPGRGSNGYSHSSEKNQHSLVVSAETEISDGATDERHHGQATVNQTTLNFAKTCMGTGTLALPYAASQGGYLFSTIGLIAMSLWNLYSVDRMIKCGDILHVIETRQRRGGPSTAQLVPLDSSDDIDIDEAKIPPGTSTFGKVVWTAFGPGGLKWFEGVMIVLMLGVTVAYEDAALSFISRTPLTSGSAKFDAFGVALAIIPLSCVPDIGFLSRFSALGIITIMFTFTVIFAYGLFGQNDTRALIDSSVIVHSLWPQSATAIANWFGVAAYSFGGVPITFNIQESMAEPHLMITATDMALKLVLVTYLVISNLVAVLFSSSPHGFEGDVLQHLPDTWIATSTRLTMAFVVVVSAPLLVVPCGEIIEGRIGVDSYSINIYRILTRVGICILTTTISVSVPGFVVVISLMGCCCVALVSFALPPLFFILLTRKKEALLAELEPVIDTSNDMRGESSTRKTDPLRLDYVMLAFGVISVVVSSYLTVGNTFKTP